MISVYSITEFNMVLLTTQSVHVLMTSIKITLNQGKMIITGAYYDIIYGLQKKSMSLIK